MSAAIKKKRIERTKIYSSIKQTQMICEKSVVIVLVADNIKLMFQAVVFNANISCARYRLF